MAVARDCAHSRSCLVKSAAGRDIPPEITGNFLSDIHNVQQRQQQFLNRNIDRFLSFHARRKAAAQSKTEDHKGSKSQVLAKVSLNEPPAHASHLDRIDATVHVPTDSTSRVNSIEVFSQSLEHPTNLPEPQSMSQACLHVKRKSAPYAPETSRLLRALRKPYESDDAVLSIDLRHIRQRLNFKDDLAHGDKRTAKRRKLSYSCHAHLTIWDNTNSQTSREPWLQKTKVCDLSIEEKTSLDSALSLSIDIRMQAPFLVSAQDLKTVRENDRWTLRYASSYFLEIKLIPLGESENIWPPIPILRKLADKGAARLDHTLVEQLQGSILLKYTGLPQPSDRSVAHPLFYLDSGNTYETKYAMELDMKWSQGALLPPNREELLPEWAIDSNEVDGVVTGRSFGRLDPRRRPKLPPLQSQRKPNRAVKTTVNRTPRLLTRESLVVVYKLPSEARSRDKDLTSFRTIKMSSLSCPICGGPPFRNLNRLRFHLSNIHHKFDFQLKKEEFFAECLMRRKIVFNVGSVIHPTDTEQEKASNDFPQQQDIVWQAPKSIFDLENHLRDESSWDSINAKPKLASNVKDAGSYTSDLDPALRRITECVKWQDVPPLRQENFSRRKYNPCKIDNPQPGRAIAYASISHRPYLYNGDESMSETDDEIDDAFLIDKSLEEIDGNSHDFMDEDMRALAKRWEVYLKGHERLPHALHLGDVVIRFVRIHRVWLTDSKTGRSNKSTRRFVALMTFLDILKYNGRISGTVCEDVLDILSTSSVVLPQQEQKLERELLSERIEPDQVKEAKLQQQDAAELYSSAFGRERRLDCCPVCQNLVSRNDSTRVHCSKPTCSRVVQWYHGECVDLSPPRARAPVAEKHTYSLRASTWICAPCAASIELEKQVHDPTPLHLIFEPDRGKSARPATKRPNDDNNHKRKELRRRGLKN